MATPQVVGSREPAATTACDALVVGAFTDDGRARLPAGVPLDAELRTEVDRATTDAGFKGKLGEVLVIPTLGRAPARAIAVTGLGNEATVTGGAVRRAAAAAARRLAERTTIVTTLHECHPDGERSVAEGFVLGTYRFTTYKSDPQQSKIARVLVPGAGDDALRAGVTHANATMLARDLVNEPASSLTPSTLADRVQQIAEDRGLECDVLDEAELAERGFGGVVGVGKGSSEPPRLIRLSYSPPDPNGRVVLVGKGVTFDSGGLSLKEPKGMEQMKTDMSGAAAVIGAVSALPHLRPGVAVEAIIPAVENMPGSSALRPGDVLRHYGGRTTEVLNTDAEGRLILADALAFASESEPDALVDLATLTGAMVVALGSKATGFFSNDEALAREILAASEQAGERVWRMPLLDEYRSELDSEVADCKNSGMRYGGAIFAALFLQAFVKNGVQWAHLDIAGPARAESDSDEVTRGGSGVGTRTLLRWIEAR